MFRVVTEGKNELNLRELAEQHANDLWIPDHLTREQKADFALDHFKRMVEGELQLLVIGEARK